jgi:hypothetical protein
VNQPPVSCYFNTIQYGGCTIGKLLESSFIFIPRRKFFSFSNWLQKMPIFAFVTKKTLLLIADLRRFPLTDHVLKISIFSPKNSEHTVSKSYLYIDLSGVYVAGISDF